MALPDSPSEISAADINVELGRAATDPFDINGAEERALAGVASGTISMGDFHGKSAGGGGGDTKRWWRLYTYESNSPTYIEYAEVQFRETFGGTNLSLSATVSTNSVRTGEYSIDKAADGLTGTKFTSSSEPENIWMKFDFGQTREIAHIKIISDFGSRAPRSFSLDYSDDNINWYTVKYWNNVDWNDNESLDFDLSETTDIGLQITSVGSDGTGLTARAGFVADYLNSIFFGSVNPTTVQESNIFGMFITNDGHFTIHLGHGTNEIPFAQDFFATVDVDGINATLVSAAATYTADIGGLLPTTEWVWDTGVNIATAGWTDASSQNVVLNNATPSPTGHEFSNVYYTGTGGFWETAKSYRTESESGTDMVLGWTEPYIGVQTVLESGLPNPDDGIIKFSGTYTGGMFPPVIDFTALSTADEEFTTTANLNTNNGTWIAYIDMEFSTGFLRKLSWYAGEDIDLTINAVTIIGR